MGAFLLKIRGQKTAIINIGGGKSYAEIYSTYHVEVTTGIIEFCQDCGEPVFVTRNGTPEMVIMDSEFSTHISGIVQRMAGWILSESTQEFPKPSRSKN